MIVEHLYKMDLSVESEEGSKAMTSAQALVKDVPSLIMTLHLLQTEDNGAMMGQTMVNLTKVYLDRVGSMIDSLTCSMFLVGLSHSEMIDVG